jgi:hypothetical protein
MPEKKELFSRDELIQRVWAKEQIKDLMCRHSYYYSNEQRREELSNLWVQKENNRRSASLGSNTGFYVGMDEIIKYYVIQHEKDRYEQLEALHTCNEKVPVNSLNLAYGAIELHALNTPLVYIADDGKTARYLGYDIGVHAIAKNAETAEAYNVMGLVQADLLLEDDQWKIWHLYLQHDHALPAGGKYSEIPVDRPQSQDPIVAEFGTPTVERVNYEPMIGWEHLYEDMPKSYYSYDERNGCGPNSNLGQPYYVREGNY